MLIYLQNRQRSIKINLNNLRKTIQTLTETRYFQGLLKRSIPVKGFEGLEVCVVLVGKDAIRKMNKRYRGFDKVTDVLSFPLFAPEACLDNGMLGDVVVCPERAIQQADEYGIDPDDELLRLIIHGILHLLGYDHETDRKSSQRMLMIQNRLCTLVQSIKDKQTYFAIRD
ncbi:MAG: rRNA maturation RNase YbeY [Thermodesulfovibrionales bacterium]